MNNMFIFTDSSKCIGCLNCELACSASYYNISFDEIYQVPKPLISRNHVVKVGTKMAPMQCMHCMTPSCLSVCPHDAIQHEQHFIKIYEDKCVGCGCCSLVCPYGSIQMVPQIINTTGTQKMVAIKCNLCADVPEGPSCISYCPTDAICIIDYQQYLTIFDKKEVHI